MKKLLILLFVLFGIAGFSQDIVWKEYENISGVIIKTSNIVCHNNEILTFQIENSNDYQVTISWYEEVWIDGVCKQEGKDNPEHFRELILHPGQVVQGDCTFIESFYIGSKVYRGDVVMKLTHFQLNNIVVL
jgi:hypothetical protein|tara:strand:- start:402 stop:797 length:396 start_codon:yes stop_codon:yes gene_type:complete